jgi:hypothetical protein
MAVLLTISETINGSAVADSLAGGGTGVDFGSVVNNQYAPLIDKTLNTGAKTLYIRHDATIDPITDVKTFIQEYGVGTGFTYGGADSAAGDYTTLVNLGNASGSSKNNADGNSGGLWIDMDADASTTNQFDQANFPALVKIYGDNNTDGINLGSAYQLVGDAMVYDAPGETLASAPVAGQIGKANDTVLGDNAKCKFRIYLPDTYSDGGIVQWEAVVAYSFTA